MCRSLWATAQAPSGVRCSGARTWEWPRDFWMPAATGAPSSPVSCAAQPVVEAVAPDGVPELVHAVAVEREELRHGGDALGVEADFGACADAGEVAEFEMGDGAGQLRGQKADEAVGLLHVAGDLGEVAVGRHADGAAQGFADVVLDGLLDGEGDAGGRWAARCSRPMSWQTISSMEGVWATGQTAFDGGGDLVRVLGVDGVRAVDEDDVGAELLGFADLGAGLDAEGLGLVAGGDEGAGVGHGAGRRRAGLPRYSGWSCCSTDAKKLLRSMCRKPKRSG